MKRMRNLFTADAHAVFDLMEDPFALLKQSIRDMEEQVRLQQHSKSELSSQREKLARQLAQQKSVRDKIKQDLDTCFESDNEILARGLIKKRLYIEKQESMLQSQIQNTEESLLGIEKLIVSNQSALEEMQQQAEILAIQGETSKNISDMDLTGEITENDVEIAFLNEKNSRASS